MKETSTGQFVLDEFFDKYDVLNNCIDTMVAVYGFHSTLNYCKLRAYEDRYMSGLAYNRSCLDRADWLDNKILELKYKFRGDR